MGAGFTRKMTEAARHERSFQVAALVLLVAGEEHGKKAELPFHPQCIRNGYRVGPATRAALLCENFHVWIFDHRQVDFVRVCRGHVVDTRVELGDANCITKFRDEPGNVVEELPFGTSAPGNVKQVESTHILLRIERKHVQAGAPEMRLHSAILMQDVVIFLPCAVAAGEVDEPVAPSVWIIDREGADIGGAVTETFKYQSFRRAEPFVVAHSTFK